jgi:acyl carrier protein
MEDAKLTADQVVSKVKEIIVDKLGVEESQVTDSANFINDLGADSLDTVELIMGFEKEFGIKVPEEETGIQTVKDAVDFIKNELQKAGRLA